jgi:hypothetical protein
MLALPERSSAKPEIMPGGFGICRAPANAVIKSPSRKRDIRAI